MARGSRLRVVEKKVHEYSITCDFGKGKKGWKNVVHLLKIII